MSLNELRYLRFSFLRSIYRGLEQLICFISLIAFNISYNKVFIIFWLIVFIGYGILQLNCDRILDELEEQIKKENE